jgi:phospholipase C
MEHPVNRFRPASLALAGLLAGMGALLSVGAPATGAQTGTQTATQTATATSAYVPPVRHVFVINIENKGYDETWGPTSAAPYLARTLRAKGVLLNTYYGTAHNSQPNYVAQVSGQGPNPDMQGDCQVYADFVAAGSVAPGQVLGRGCVFPAGTPTLVSQLDAHQLTWKGYMEDMGSACVHPAVNTVDPTQKATADQMYAVRHNPFMYFHSIIDRPSYCAAHVQPLDALTGDLSSAATTPNLSYITPDLCSDGHDAPCADGQAGGLASVDAFMQRVVPQILASPAYQQDGMLVITADESDGPQSDATACCGEGASANTPLPGIVGPGGGKVGALVLSRWPSGQTWSTTPYNHYSLLASLEDVFALPHLGYAATPKLNRFGLDVYNSGWR